MGELHRLEVAVCVLQLALERRGYDFDSPIADRMKLTLEMLHKVGMGTLQTAFVEGDSELELPSIGVSVGLTGGPHRIMAEAREWRENPLRPRVDRIIVVVRATKLRGSQNFGADVEVFAMDELQVDIFALPSVPPHFVVPRSKSRKVSGEVRKTLPRIDLLDPAAKRIGARVNDLVRIERPRADGVGYPYGHPLWMPGSVVVRVVVAPVEWNEKGPRRNARRDWTTLPHINFATLFEPPITTDMHRGGGGGEGVSAAAALATVQASTRLSTATPTPTPTTR